MKTIGKINGLLAASTFALLMSCNNNDKVAVKENVVPEREYVAMVSAKNTAEHNLYLAMNEIDNNLKKIRDGQSALATNFNTRAEKLSKKEEILRTLNEINSLLSENQLKIEKLNTQLVSYRSQKKRWKKESDEFAKFIEEKGAEITHLQEQIAEQTNTINGLNQKVNDLQVANESAKDRSVMMDTELRLKTDELHRAYYAMGSSKELKKHNVIEKKGGVLGVGRVEELKPDFEKAYFTTIDTRQVTSIPISSTKAKLVTHHPVGSYEWDKTSGNAEYLTIKDPDKFWSTSKYLVVEVK